ncbi:uncharacterized protein LOC133927964 [Phragmites australis]|uniref:uncharacterized protein LOC133927964 n=1 Tax=Phragmites australis TaxID=29695 RepID=UPI002D771704|nr:uncharacterized protein LOC133927964 [Phragmites australis]
MMESESSASPSAQAAASNSNVVDEERLRKTPLWRHVKVLQKNGASGGNARSECLYCGHIIPGSYSRVRAHLFKVPNQVTSICSVATPEMVEQFRREEGAAKATTEASTQRSAPMPVQLPLSTKASKKKKQTCILESFHLELRQMADAIIARMFYTGGIPFNMTFAWEVKLPYPTEEEREGYSCDDCFDDLCKEMSRMAVFDEEEKAGLPQFEGRYTRFIYNSDNEIERDGVVDAAEARACRCRRGGICASTRMRRRIKHMHITAV